jgi:hypothetical protein
MLACGPAHNPIDLLPYVVIAAAALTRDFQGKHYRIAGFASKSDQRKEGDG